jgi:hypothetical protein
MQKTTILSQDQPIPTTNLCHSISIHSTSFGLPITLYENQEMMINHPQRICTVKPAHNGTAMEQNFILLLENSDSNQYFTYGSSGLQIIQTVKLFH